MNRPHPRHTGAYQRCTADCPADRCRSHKWAWTVELPMVGGDRRRLGKGGYETAKDAADERARTIHQHREGTLPRDGGKRPFGAYLLEWLALKIERGELRDTTARGYRDFAEDYLVPKLGPVKLADLTPQMVERVYLELMRERREARAAAIARNQRYAEQAAVADERRQARGLRRPIKAKRIGIPPPLGPTTIKRVHAVLSGALRSAHKTGLVQRNIATLVTLPKAERPKVRPWSADQYGQFLSWLEQHEPRWLAPFLVSGLGGLRRGELAALQWADLDLQTGLVSIERQRVSAGYRVVERTTKTSAGERSAFLPPAACLVLRQWRKTRAEERLAFGEGYTDTDYVFCWEDGRPYHPEQLTKTFSRLARHAGLPHVRLHDLRHLAASLHLAAGTEMGVVSKLLGHSSVKITIDTYSHLAEQTGRDAVEKAADIVPWRRTA